LRGSDKRVDDEVTGTGVDGRIPCSSMDVLSCGKFTVDGDKMA
jgi:hypothetical protein